MPPTLKKPPEGYPFIVHITKLSGKQIWWTTLPNWHAEYHERTRKGVTDPYINPKTSMPYSKNAIHYRENFLLIHIEDPYTKAETANQ